MPTLTPEAKQLLSSTVRGLRERLIRDIRDEAERRYRLSVPAAQAGLDEGHSRRRERLHSWLDERMRARQRKGETRGEGEHAEQGREALRERLLQEAVTEAGATLINRLVVIRHLEALGFLKPCVVTGGWNSPAYREFRDFSAALLEDETEGYATLLQVVFDELSVNLPGLFGEVGLTGLLPIPPATLREVVTKLDAKELESAWTDDTTLGWVYQYWNDPERERLDAKLGNGGKVEPHEIASKTQMFTERYMVEWLLQNSLGLTWLGICKKNGWPADAERAIATLDARRAEWRRRREAGEVALDAPMPVEGELENAWKYYVPQAIAAEVVAQAPASIRELKLLDPACGSGHFLVIAFDGLAEMYREEARHRGTDCSCEDIAEAILANNLHGIDIDPRAIQIAAAALYLKAKAFAPESRLRTMNLAAPALPLAHLPEDDPSVVQLCRELRKETGVAEDLTRRLVTALAGASHLGPLLKMDLAVDEALESAEVVSERVRPRRAQPVEPSTVEQVKRAPSEARATVLRKVEQLLARHSASEDLGLRLHGEQLAAGVRFARMVTEGKYDVVVGNPPYQGTQRLADTAYLDRTYHLSKEDLYAVFMERGLELARRSGLEAFVTIRSWMYVSHFRRFRESLLSTYQLCVLADLGTGGFEAVGVEAVMAVWRKAPPGDTTSIALRSVGRKAAELVGQPNRFAFCGALLRRIPGAPIVYQWSQEFVLRYLTLPKLGLESPARVGMKTSNNARFVRYPWEVARAEVDAFRVADPRLPRSKWVPYVKGAEGKAWIEPLANVVRWWRNGLEIRLALQAAYGQAPQCERLYFVPGVAFTTIARRFLARVHRYRSIFDVAGSSVFCADPADIVCLLNSERARWFVEAVNPTINFQVGDVNRLPRLPIAGAAAILEKLQTAFSEHEAHRETSVEFKRPGPSPWPYAQDWAQRAVDRAEGDPLPPYEPVYEPPSPESFVSFAVGLALGRFGAPHEEVLARAPDLALPAGILFVAPDGADGLEHSACTRLHEAWMEHGATVGRGDDVRGYLRRAFFEYHRKLYENRPIYLPLSSAKRSYVAFVSIHRWTDDTLKVLLAEYLLPERRRLEAELEELRRARIEPMSRGRFEKRWVEVQRLLEELSGFVDKVIEVAERGPPCPDEDTGKREVNAPFALDLDDGVMINSAALWPLLEPQWKDPRRWWKELATARGRKDYDWAHLAARYFPARVRHKCVADPSLAVAHRCFWELHAAKAYAWELRLQGQGFADGAIDEIGADSARPRFLEEHAEAAVEIRAAEQMNRRAR